MSSSSSRSTASHTRTWSYPLRRYMRSAWLPGWFAFPIDDEGGDRIISDGAAKPWPRYDSLVRPVGDRWLREVRRLPLSELQDLSAKCMNELPFVAIEGRASQDSGSLRLPNPDFLDLDERDLARLSQDIGLKGEFARLVEDYVLCTLSEALRLLHGVSSTSKRAERLLFQHSEWIQLADAKWDIFTLPGRKADTNAMIVITVPPWSFGFRNFEEFTKPRRTARGSLDKLRPGDNWDVIWAVLIDACTQTDCHYFAVTTYDSWVFGNFSYNHIVASVTPCFHAPALVDHRGEVTYLDEPKSPEGEETGFMERLMYWAEAGRGFAEGCLPSESTSGTWVMTFKDSSGD